MGSLKAALASVPPSPMFNTLQAAHRALLTKSGPEAQELRRKALRGAIVVFFTAGYRCGACMLLCLWQTQRPPGSMHF